MLISERREPCLTRGSFSFRSSSPSDLPPPGPRLANLMNGQPGYPIASLDNAGAVPSSVTCRSRYGEAHPGKRMRRAAATWQISSPGIHVVVLRLAWLGLGRPRLPGAVLGIWDGAQRSPRPHAHPDALPRRSPD